jgi:hypothetical protein
VAGGRDARWRARASAQAESVSQLPELLIRELRVVGAMALAVLDEPQDGFQVTKGREPATLEVGLQAGLPSLGKAIRPSEAANHRLAYKSQLPTRFGQFDPCQIPVDNAAVCPGSLGLPPQPFCLGMACAALVNPAFSARIAPPELIGSLVTLALSTDELGRRRYAVDGHALHRVR